MKRIVLTAAGAVVAVASFAVAQSFRAKPTIAHHTALASATSAPTTSVARPAEFRTDSAGINTARAALSRGEPTPAPVVTAAVVTLPAPPIVEPTAALALDAEKKDEKPDLAAAPPAPPPPPVISLVAKIDLATQRMTVLEHGKAKYTWIISSGAKGYDTPRGLFQPSWMAKEWFSRQYDNAPMPHAVFFKDGAAVHATMNPASLGTPASHGCVRLSKANAAIFYAMVQRHGMKHSRIHVYGVPRHAPEAVATRTPPRQSPTTLRYAGYGYAQPNPMAYAAPASTQPYYGPSGSAIARPVGGSVYRPAQIRVVQ